MRQLAVHFGLAGALVVLVALAYDRWWPSEPARTAPPLEMSLERRQAAAKRAVALEAAKAKLAKLEYSRFCSTLGTTLRAGKTGLDAQAVLEVAAESYRVHPAMYSLIEQRKIGVGMSLCAVMAAIGTPTEVREIGTPSGKAFSVWYRDRNALLYLDARQVVTHFSY